MDIGKLKSFNNFRRDIKSIFENTISNFFNSEIKIYEYPTAQLEKDFGIKILEKPKRGVYITNDKIIIVSKIYNGKIPEYFIGLSISKSRLIKNTIIFNEFESALTSSLTSSFHFSFKHSIMLFDENLIKKTITNYCTKGYYEPTKFTYLIHYFNRLRTTSYEGSYFSTGFILTRSAYGYKGTVTKEARDIHFHNLKDIYDIPREDIKRRFWYLADGKRTFYLGNRLNQVTSVITLKTDSNINFIDNLTLSTVLKGGDILFRVENEKEFSIVHSDESEFIYSENHWKYRDYSAVIDFFTINHQLERDVIERILFFVVYCSKQGISSIIWIPNDFSKVEDILKSTNRLFRNNINIKEEAYTNQVIRFISSDGATIIDKSGELKNYGCIVNIEKAKIKGLKGTGESAAGLLATNGIAIKVSQDGTIKMFSESEIPIII